MALYYLISLMIDIIKRVSFLERYCKIVSFQLNVAQRHTSTHLRPTMTLSKWRFNRIRQIRPDRRRIDRPRQRKVTSSNDPLSSVRWMIWADASLRHTKKPWQPPWPLSSSTRFHPLTTSPTSSAPRASPPFRSSSSGGSWASKQNSFYWQKKKHLMKHDKGFQPLSTWPR